MREKDYIQDMGSTIEKYKAKILKIERFLNDYTSEDKAHLLSENKLLQEKVKKGEDIFNKLKSSTEENYEEIREAFGKSLEAIKEGFREFSTLLTMEQLWRAKDEIKDYGYEKIDEIKEYGYEKIDDLHDYIKKRPILTAACALGVGFLVGTLLKAKQ